jgi:hypothetical protein
MDSPGRSWFRCFAEVPGVSYAGDPQRRARLPGSNDVPEVDEYIDDDGKPHVFLTWSEPGGSTSESPAARFGETDSKSSEQTRERVLSVLELPGEIEDYHYALQNAVSDRRRTEPTYLPFVEQLAWLDAELVETHESLFRRPEDDDFLPIAALDFLVRVRVQEGFLHEALAIAERFKRLLPNDLVDELRTRVANLQREQS